MRRQIWLVRHPAVAALWNGRCYGVSDAGLGWEGLAEARGLVERLVALAPDLVVHSGMRRTRLIAERVARRLGLAALQDVRWRERDFGGWEGLPWDAVYRATGSAMDGMLTDPYDFRPGGGETTAELWERAIAAWEALPRGGRIVVVAHGGPIAVVRAALGKVGFADLPACMLPTGSVCRIGE